MKIGFVSRHAPHDRRAWSGTNFKLFEQLSRHHTVTHIPYRRDVLAKAFGVGLKGAARLRGQNAVIDATRFVAQRMASSLDMKALKNADVLFFPGGSSCLAMIDTMTPIVYLTDATFTSMSGYYPSFSNLPNFNRRQGVKLEAQALEKATRIIVSSDWARKSVINDYGQAPAKVTTIEFGANLVEDDPNAMRALRVECLADSPSKVSPLSLLFIGVEWQRKGGEEAVACCQELNDTGVPVRLHVVGTQLPPQHRALPFLVDHGFLDKNDPRKLENLQRLMAVSDLMLLPTRAECSPIAFCEASAYGLPVITIDTGGLSNYVVNGFNGYRLAQGSTGQDFAAKVRKIVASGELARLREGAFMMYKQKLNWNRWGGLFNELLTEMMQAPTELRTHR